MDLDNPAEVATEPAKNISAFLDSPISLKNYGDRMVKFAGEHGLPMDRPVTRRELSSLGYGMINEVGEGERVIIQECGGEDWRHKPLLTVDELKSSIAETCPAGLSAADLKEIGADMETFIDEVQTLAMLEIHFGHRGVSQNGNRLNLLAMRLKIEDQVKAADMYNYKKKVAIIEAAQQTIRREFNIPDNVRGIPVGNVNTRGEGKVNGDRCPTFNCPHVFSNAGGALIYDTEGALTGQPRTLRLNSVVAHLAEHGISETGEAAHDQQYMTIKEYLPLFHRRADSVALKVLNEDRIGLQVFLAAAREYLKAVGVTNIPESEILKYGKEFFFIKD